MSAPFTYERTPGDKSAEIAADDAALIGQWAEFARESDGTTQVDSIPEEAAEAIDMRRGEDRTQWRDALVRAGVPYGLVELKLEEFDKDRPPLSRK